MNPINEFRNAMERGLGVQLPRIFTPIADGQIHRLRDPRKGSSDQSLWYVLFGDAVPAGRYGNWSTGEGGTWSAKAGSEMTMEEKAAMRERAHREKQKRNDTLARQQ